MVWIFCCIASEIGTLLFWAARLVLALGAEAKLDVVPGAVEYAFPFSTLEDAQVSV